jgi:hypothetical protein
MTVNFTTLFTRLGKYFGVGEEIVTALGTTIPGSTDTAIDGLGTGNGAEYEEVREGVRLALRALQGAGASGIDGLVSIPTVNLLRITVAEDAPFAYTTDLALRELIRQMEAGSESLDAATVGASVTYGGSNAGDGLIMVSTKRADGRNAELLLAESIEALATVNSLGTTFSLTTPDPVSPSSPLWPGGSGISSRLSSRTAASSDNLVTNGTFEENSDESSHLPESWLAPTATLGTTLKLSSVEQQTVAISGTPSGGYYTLSWTNASSQVQTTAPIPYDATASDVQAALRALTGLEGVEVSETGTSPDVTHTVVFYGVTNPAQLTSTSALTGGTPAIGHATTVAGSANVLRGARAVELDSDGAELTTLMVQVALQPLTQYAASLFAQVDSVPAAGVLTVDLVDGVGGTVIADEQGTNNSYTIDATALTTAWAASSGWFRTPATLPAQCYLRIRISTAVSNTTSVFLDEVALVAGNELYPDGPVISIIEGEDAWEPSDRAVIALTNDRAGKIHEWLDRVFGLRERRLLFPTDSSGTETVDDALVV